MGVRAGDVSPTQMRAVICTRRTPPIDEASDLAYDLRAGLHLMATAFLEVLEEREQTMFKTTFLWYRDLYEDDWQMMKLAALSVAETDAFRTLLARGHRGSAAADAAEYDLSTSELIDAVTAYRRETRLGFHYEGHSAHHRSDSKGHDNLHRLVEDGTPDE